ncbi:MAG: hypothetical protein EZS28_024589 [Streblomastix strix]|uniref:Uncharacterized protein n=1 Tax=Streblomastix strix TaxID=222440 RepID=A0A5J4VBY7_9EUKA|nr:MAG: hypothetical protein EZS28_024589 [Streblomastix strix]
MLTQLNNQKLVLVIDLEANNWDSNRHRQRGFIRTYQNIKSELNEKIATETTQSQLGNRQAGMLSVYDTFLKQ